MAARSTLRSTGPADAPAAAGVPREAVLAVVVATAGFAVNFWAWALLSPLGPGFRDRLDLSASELSLLVAVPVLVGYVAFSVYLPTYLRESYGLEQDDAATKMAGFVVLAVLMRPVGGWVCDRLPPLRVLAATFALVAVCAAVQSTTPDLDPVGTLAFLTMAACLGAASGAVFTHVAQRAPQAQVGSVTGLVGAAGGLGGFVPPLVMGAVFTRTGSYAGGLLALAVVAALSAVWCLFLSRSEAA